MVDIDELLILKYIKCDFFSERIKKSHNIIYLIEVYHSIYLILCRSYEWINQLMEVFLQSFAGTWFDFFGYTVVRNIKF